MTHAGCVCVLRTRRRCRLQVPGFYSDFLYEPWACASMDINPAWLATDNVTRVHAPSVEEFVELFERPNKPGVRVCVAPTSSVRHAMTLG